MLNTNNISISITIAKLLAGIFESCRFTLILKHQFAVAVFILATNIVKADVLDQQIKDDLLSGNLRISYSIFGRGASGSKELRELHDKEMWEKLVSSIIEKKFVVDTYYYYLGRAAEALGSTDAAITYYDLAVEANKSTITKCTDGGMWDTCAGFQMPEAAATRRSIAAQSIQENVKTLQIGEGPTLSESFNAKTVILQMLPRSASAQYMNVAKDKIKMYFSDNLRRLVTIEARFEPEKLHPIWYDPTEDKKKLTRFYRENVIDCTSYCKSKLNGHIQFNDITKFNIIDYNAEAIKVESTTGVTAYIPISYGVELGKDYPIIDDLWNKLEPKSFSEGLGSQFVFFMDHPALFKYQRFLVAGERTINMMVNYNKNDNSPNPLNLSPPDTKAFTGKIKRYELTESSIDFIIETTSGDVKLINYLSNKLNTDDCFPFFLARESRAEDNSKDLLRPVTKLKEDTNPLKIAVLPPKHSKHLYNEKNPLGNYPLGKLDPKDLILWIENSKPKDDDFEKKSLTQEKLKAFSESIRNNVFVFEIPQEYIEYTRYDSDKEQFLPFVNAYSLSFSNSSKSIRDGHTNHIDALINNTPIGIPRYRSKNYTIKLDMDNSGFKKTFVITNPALYIPMPLEQAKKTNPKNIKALVVGYFDEEINDKSFFSPPSHISLSASYVYAKEATVHPTEIILFNSASREIYSRIKLARSRESVGTLRCE